MENKILNEVNSVFNELLGKTVSLTEETTPEEVEGWDSLFQANLIEKIENQYGIKFKLREILAWESVGNIIESIQNRL